MNLLEVVGKPVDSSYCLIKIGGTAIVTTTGQDIDLSSSIEDYVYTLDNIPVRWFPVRWTIPERKEREKFMAVLG